MIYRRFDYYETPEQTDARALARLRVVLAHELYEVPPPSDDEREAIDRAVARERSKGAA